MTHVTFDFQSGAVLVVIAAPPVLPHRPTRSHAHRADAETGRRKGSADGDSGGFHWRRSAIVGFPGQMPRRRPRRTVRPRRSPAQSRHHLQALPRPARMRSRRPRQSRRIRSLGRHDRTPAARPPAPAPRSHLLGRILRSPKAPPGCVGLRPLASLADRGSCGPEVVFFPRRTRSQAPSRSSVQTTRPDLPPALLCKYCVFRLSHASLRTILDHTVRAEGVVPCLLFPSASRLFMRVGS